MNPLVDSGLPLVFRVDDTVLSGLGRADARLGDSCRTAVRSLSHMQKEALVRSTRTGVTWRLASDEGDYLDGLDAAPCPLCFMTTGMVAASMNEILALAKQRNITINNIRLVQDNYYTMTGSMLRGTMTGGAKNIALEAQIDADCDFLELQQLVEEAVTLSPLYGLIQGEHVSLFALAHNSKEVPVGNTTPVDGQLLPDPGPVFDLVRPADEAMGAVITNTGRKTERMEHTNSTQGSSLAAEQDRILHIRGICTLREDGVKEIEQHLFNPLGTVYRLLSQEVPDDGSPPVAPDALTYISAGIGFCFMTQFGRAAVIFKKELDDYRIVQDTFFSRGGASGGTGLTGQADPVETHAYLQSVFDDDYACHVLDMAEQTCFLHALCRTDLKTEVTVTRQK